MLAEKVKKALLRACERAGNRLRFAQQRAVPYATVSRILNNKRSAANLSVATLEKLFPEMDMIFFADERSLPGGGSISTLNEKILELLNQLPEAERLELHAELYLRVKARRNGEAQKTSE